MGHVEGANRLPGVATGFVVVLLEPVQFLDHGQWDHHLMFGEFEQRVRVVEKHIGIQNEILLGSFI